MSGRSGTEVLGREEGPCELSGACCLLRFLLFQQGNADNRQQAALSILKLKILKFVEAFKLSDLLSADANGAPMGPHVLSRAQQELGSPGQLLTGPSAVFCASAIDSPSE